MIFKKLRNYSPPPVDKIKVGKVLIFKNDENKNLINNNKTINANASYNNNSELEKASILVENN